MIAEITSLTADMRIKAIR